MRRAPDRFETMTSDNGTEFHDYESVETAARVQFFFATPYHSWERGSNENFNGLLRQYLPKRASQAGLTCSGIEHRRSVFLETRQCCGANLISDGILREVVLWGIEIT